MDMKKIGLIALAVVAVGLLAWSFKNSFANSVPTAGADQAQQMKARYQQMQQQPPASSPRMGGGHSPAAAPAGK